MIYINRIRKIYGTAAALGLTACLLFGCTRADVATSSGSAASGSQAAATGTATSTVSEGSLAGAGSASGSSAPGSSASAAGSASAESSAGTAASGESQQTAAPAAQNVTGTTTPAAPQTNAASQSAAPAQPSTAPASPEAAPAAEPEVMDESDDYDIGEEYAVESISGEFEKSDGTESVVLSLLSDNQISFQFRESGIGAYAEASGTTAVYTGDDGYSILFDVAGDTLAVTISGEGGEESPMNGIYYRVLDGGDDSDEGLYSDEPDAEDQDDSIYADAQ